MTKRQQTRARAELREAARFFPAVAALLDVVDLMESGPTSELQPEHWETWKLATQAARSR